MQKEQKPNLENYLSEFHTGLHHLQDVLLDLKSIKQNMQYTFPHIADDLGERIVELQMGIDLVSKGMNNKMDLDLQNHNQMVGSMFTALLHRT